MISEYLLLLILILLAEIVKRLRSQQRPLALAGSGMLQPWQAWELLQMQAKGDSIGRWG